MPLTPDTIHGLAGLAAREALASTVNNGCCGFASVHFAGNTAFGRWMKANKLAKKAIVGGGLYIWCPYYSQSHIQKAMWAQAFVRLG